jgi:dienelactone hydrolase
VAYLTSEAYLLERFDRQGRQAGLPADITPEQFPLWQAQLREKLAEKLGLNTFQTCPLEPSYDQVESFEGYSSQRVEISTELSIRMPFYVLTPADMSPGDRRPVILALHGHGGGGKEAVAGRREVPIIAERIDFYNYDYGRQLVKAGYIVLCPDARGFGERRETVAQGDDAEQIINNSCRIINNMALPLGQTLAGMMTWDLMRLVDYAATRSDCDMNRVGCMGLSGGGLQTLWLSIFDQRVKVAVTSGYFYGCKDALLRLNANCSCNYVPGLWQLVDMGDLGALICPRPLLVESGLRDPLNGERGIVNVTEQLAITSQAYKLAGAENKLYHSVFDGPHRYDGREVIPWFNHWFAFNRA